MFNPKGVAVMWFLTLLTIVIAIVAPEFVWIPLSLSGLYVIYSIV